MLRVGAAVEGPEPDRAVLRRAAPSAAVLVHGPDPARQLVLDQDRAAVLMGEEIAQASLVVSIRIRRRGGGIFLTSHFSVSARAASLAFSPRTP